MPTVRSALVVTMLGLWATRLTAQALVGIVVDSVTHRPLHGVYVTIPDAGLEGRTNVDGVFEIAGIAAGEQVVLFRGPGYAGAGMRIRLTLTDHRNVSVGIITLSPAATVSGFVLDSASQAPIRDVEVRIPALNLSAMTDDQGEFLLDGVPGGEHDFEFRRLGYLGAVITATLSVDAPSQLSLGAIALAPTALLETIEVTAPAGESMIMPDFAHLKRTGQGRYITAEDIERLHPSNTSEILRRLGGFTMSGDDGIGAGGGVVSGARSGTSCTTGYFIDGVRSTSNSLDMIQPRAVAGIEIYDGPATIPAQYQTPGAPVCGLIVVWTKDASNRGR